MIAFISYALCTGVYWLPAGQACCAVGAVMLRCPSLALLPAALLRPAILWQLALVVLACERWQGRAFADFGMLRSEFYLEVRRLADAPASDGRRGTAPPFYQSLLDKLDEMVSRCNHFSSLSLNQPWFQPRVAREACRRRRPSGRQCISH